jgi:hypothetical protein
MVRRELGLSSGRPLVLVTMGGLGGSELVAAAAALKTMKGVDFALPGTAGQMIKDGNLLLLPANSGLYHPDLVGASDVVIGKVGYSTLAEVYQAGCVYGYIQRPNFPESAKLVEFIEQEMHGMDCSDAYHMHCLPELVPQLLQLGQQEGHRPNGASEVARFIVSSIASYYGIAETT